MAADIRAEVRKGVYEWIAAGNRRPQLTAVIVGEDPASQTYVKNKMKAAADTGNNINQGQHFLEIFYPRIYFKVFKNSNFQWWFEICKILFFFLKKVLS